MSDSVDVLQRLEKCEQRLDDLEGKPGYTCVSCKAKQPPNHYWYAATHKETKETVFPICALCIRGEKTDRFIGLAWKHAGPNKQPVYK